MEYYRHTYASSKMWQGEPLKNKIIIVYCEQGYGDIIQFIRFVPILQTKECKVILHCPLDLHPLMPYVCNVDLIDKDNPNLPIHDYHVLSMNLPFLLLHGAACPYIHINKKADIGEGFKIGIAWEGNPEHENSMNRDCPLKYFKPLFDIAKIFSLQKNIHNHKLLESCELFDLFGIQINTFIDTVELINAVNLVVTVDTSILHLAGALNKPTYALLSNQADARWGTIENKTFWYPSVKLFRQTNEGWKPLLDKVAEQVRKLI